MSRSESPWSYKFVRNQFLITNLNKNHYTLSYGQLNFAFSRIKLKKQLKILIHDNKHKQCLNITTNTIFKEYFHKI